MTIIHHRMLFNCVAVSLYHKKRQNTIFFTACLAFTINKITKRGNCDSENALGNINIIDSVVLLSLYVETAEQGAAGSNHLTKDSAHRLKFRTLAATRFQSNNPLSYDSYQAISVVLMEPFFALPRSTDRRRFGCNPDSRSRRYSRERLKQIQTQNQK